MTDPIAGQRKVPDKNDKKVWCHFLRTVIAIQEVTTGPVIYGMRSCIHSQISTVQALKFVSGYGIRPYVKTDVITYPWWHQNQSSLVEWLLAEGSLIGTGMTWLINGDKFVQFDSMIRFYLEIVRYSDLNNFAWWRPQMETFSASLALCSGNSPVPVSSPHKGQWCEALNFSLICAWINDWVNNRELVIWDSIVPIMTAI